MSSLFFRYMSYSLKLSIRLLGKITSFFNFISTINCSKCNPIDSYELLSLNKSELSISSLYSFWIDVIFDVILYWCKLQLKHERN